jgi:hypothetical protein
MTTRRPKYGEEEFATRGDAIYDRDVMPHAKPRQTGLFVALDIASGDFEIDPNEMAACDRFLERQPNAQIWLRRVGLRYTYRMLAHMVAT